MSLTKHKPKQDTLEKKVLDTLAPILPCDAEHKVAQIKSNGVVITVTIVVEVVVVMKLCDKLKRPYRERETKMITIMNSLKQHERDYFYNVICRLGLVQTLGHVLSNLELSNELLQRGYGCLGDLNLFGLLLDSRTEHQQLDYTPSPGFSFIHVEVQRFLAAIHLLKSPLMEIIVFIKKSILVNTPIEVSFNSSIVLKYVFGLAKTIFGDGSTILLQNVLKFLTQHINRDAPIIDSRISLLILQCLFEAQEVVLYRQVQNETFVRQIFSYEAQIIDENIDAIAYYILNTSSDSKQSAWTIYAPNKQKYGLLTKKLTEIKAPYNTKTTNKLFSSPSDSSRIVISNKNYDYLISVLTDVTTTGTDSASMTQERRSSSSSVQSLESRKDSSASFTSAASTASGKVPSSEHTTLSLSYVSSDIQFLPPFNSTDIVLGPYGYLTKEQFESDRAAETTFYSNMVKDFINPYLQMHCPTLVPTQDCKNDHIWFSFSPSMRYSFYKSVQITPVVPMHWVKVPQPDGTTDLEDKFKEKAIASQSSSVQPSTNEVAELILLNSHRMERISITPPDGGSPVLISICRNSEQSETGEVGCDYLMPFYEVQETVQWKMDSHEIKKDQQIGHELPLPSKKGTESAQMTTSTAMANLKDLSGAVENTTTPDINVSEQQIKRQAMEGFDKPGFCFYGDDIVFQMNCMYTLPEELPHTRTLREGRNGTVLEVFYEGTFYAVKRAAFRWREVLIMPKLKHKNILKLVTMLMGAPMADYPRRRIVYQYFPRMTNDLEQCIGSYDKYCLRTLKEQYREKASQLSKVQSNFKYVAHEILSALNYLHTLRCPIIHRNVKPSNILVKMNCGCANPLVCFCGNQPQIMLSDFDASLELTSEGELIPDSAHSRSQSYYTTQQRLYHISPVGTIGFKSPESFMHLVANSLEVLPQLSTKADIFSFGSLMALLFVNEYGPKHISQIATLLLSMNQTVDGKGRLPQSKINLLKRSGITPREKHFTITETDKQRVLPTKRLSRDFRETPKLDSFVRKALAVDPKLRPTAQELLSHPFMEEKDQSSVLSTTSTELVSSNSREMKKILTTLCDRDDFGDRNTDKQVGCNYLTPSSQEEQVPIERKDLLTTRKEPPSLLTKDTATVSYLQLSDVPTILKEPSSNESSIAKDIQSFPTPP